MNLNESCHYKTNLPHLASEIAKNSITMFSGQGILYAETIFI